jgi:hypothetical protein
MNKITAASRDLVRIFCMQQTTKGKSSYYSPGIQWRLPHRYYLNIQIPPEPFAAYRAEIMSLQHRRYFASSCKSCVLTLIFALSLVMVLRSVSLGLPRVLVPAGVQLKACRGSHLLSILNTCPRYFQRSLFINVETSSCFVSSLNVLFDLNSFQCVLNIT